MSLLKKAPKDVSVTKGWTLTKRDYPPSKLRDATNEEVSNLKKAANACVENIETIIGVKLAYNQESLKRLDDLIDSHWGGMNPPEGFKGEIVVMGAFLGECINGNLGSHWVYDENNKMFGVQHEKVGTAFPFNKVEKRFYIGRTNCLETMYEAFEDALNPVAS